MSVCVLRECTYIVECHVTAMCVCVLRECTYIVGCHVTAVCVCVCVCVEGVHLRCDGTRK